MNMEFSFDAGLQGGLIGVEELVFACAYFDGYFEDSVGGGLVRFDLDELSELSVELWLLDEDAVHDGEGADEAHVEEGVLRDVRDHVPVLGVDEDRTLAQTSRFAALTRPSLLLRVFPRKSHLSALCI